MRKLIRSDEDGIIHSDEDGSIKRTNSTAAVLSRRFAASILFFAV